MSDAVSREDAYAAIRGLTRHIDRIAAIRALPAVQPMTVQETARCEYCDGTGDVHAIDGEWRGYCSCGAGATIRALPAVQPDAVRLRQLLEAIVDEYNDQTFGPIMHSIVAARAELEGTD